MRAAPTARSTTPRPPSSKHSSRPRREPKLAKAIAEARARWRVTIGEPLAQQAIAEGVASPDADFDSIIYFLESLNLGLLVQRGAGQLPPDPEAWARFLGRVMRSMGQMTTKTDRPQDQK